MAYKRLVFSDELTSVGSGTYLPLSGGTLTGGIEVDKSSDPYLRATDGTKTMYAGYITSSGGMLGTSTNHPLEIRTNNTARLTFSADGKVGIGRTPTNYPLEVKGSVELKSSGRVFLETGGAIADNGSNTWLMVPKDGSSRQAFYTAGSLAMYFDSNQNATFSGNTTISHASNPVLSVIDTTNNARWSAYVTDTKVWMGAISNHPLAILQNDTERITIDTNGNATFSGDVTTGKTLDIKGALTEDSTLRLLTDNAGIGADYWRIRHANSDHKIYFEDYSSGSYVSKFSLAQDGTATFSGDIKVGSDLVINGASNRKIRRSVDTDLLDLTGGNSYHGGHIRMYGGSSSALGGNAGSIQFITSEDTGSYYTSCMRIVDKKIGMGVRSHGINPDRMLTLRGDSTTTGSAYPSIHGTTLISGVDQTLWVMEQWYGDEGYLGLYKANVKKVQFRADGDSYINGGNLGFNVSSPSRKIHIDQNVATQGGLYVYSNAIHTGSGTNALIGVYSDNASANGDTLYVRNDGTGNILTLNNGGTDRLVVSPNGTATFSGIINSNSHLIVADGYSIKGGSSQQQIINMSGTTINIGGEGNNATFGGKFGVGADPTHAIHGVSTDNKGFFLYKNLGNNADSLDEFSAYYSLSILNRNGGSYLNFGGDANRTDIQATDGASSATAKNIYLNPFGGNVSIGQNKGANATDTQLSIYGGEGKSAILELLADNSDDTSDYSRIMKDTDGSLKFQFHTGSAWSNHLGLSSTTATFSGYVAIKDSQYLYLGNGNDLGLLHNGSHSYINNSTGNLYIKQNASGSSVVFHTMFGGSSQAVFEITDAGIYQGLGTSYLHGAGKISLTNKTANNAWTGFDIQHNSSNGLDIIKKSYSGSGDVTAININSAGQVTFATSPVFTDLQSKYASQYPTTATLSTADTVGNLNLAHSNGASCELKFQINGTTNTSLIPNVSYHWTADSGGSTAYNQYFKMSDGTNIGQIEFHPTGTSQIVTRVNQPLAFGVNNSHKMTIGTTGYIGLGISSADTNLHIHKGSAGSVDTNSNAQFTIENSDHNAMQFLSPNDKNNIIYFGDVDDNDVGYINYVHSSNTMNFQTNTAVRMSIDGSGNTTFSGNLNLHGANASGLNEFITIRPSGISSVYSGIGLRDGNGDLTLFSDRDGVSTGNVIFEVGGHERARITSTSATFQGAVTLDQTSPYLHLKSAVNNTGMIRFTETSYQGGYIKYDGSGNNLVIGVHHIEDSNTSNDIDSLYFDRGSGRATFTKGAYVRPASSGATAHTEADNLVIEDSATTGMSILFPSSSKGSLMFGHQSNNSAFSIVADSNNNRMSFSANQTYDKMKFNVAGSENLELRGASGSEIATFTGEVYVNGSTLHVKGSNAQFYLKNSSDNYYKHYINDTDHNLYSYYNSTLIRAYSPTVGWDIRGDVTHSGQILASNGTASAPAYAFGSQASTGMYKGGTSLLYFSVNGTRKVRVESTQIVLEDEVYCTDTLGVTGVASFSGRVDGNIAGFYLKEGSSNAFSMKSNGANGYLLFRDEYNSKDRLKIEQSGHITVSEGISVGGKITSSGVTNTHELLLLKAGAGNHYPYMRIERNNGSYKWDIGMNSDSLSALFFKRSDGGTALKLDTDLSATFEGNIHAKADINLTDYSGSTDNTLMRINLDGANRDIIKLVSDSGKGVLRLYDGANTLGTELHGNGTSTFNNDVLVNDAGLQLKSTNAGASENPVLSLIRDSASPTIGDKLGMIEFKGEDTMGASENYVDMYAFIDEVTHSIERGGLHFRTMKAGTKAEILTLKGDTVIIGHNYDATADGKLHIAGINGVGIALNNASSGNNNTIRFQDGGQDKWDLGQNGSGDLTLYGYESGTTIMYVDGGTEYVTFSNRVYVSSSISVTSDIRYKSDIATITNSLDTVSKLRGVSYTDIRNNEQKLGVIAQEVESIIPTAVATEEHKSVDYNQIIPMLIESIKELKHEVETLKAKIGD